MNNEAENRLSYTRDEYKQLERENEQLKEFIEETDNAKAYRQWVNCNL